MKKFKEWIRNNYVVFLCMIVLIAIICYGFCNYIHMYYGYDYEKVVELYWKSVEWCDSGKSVNKEFCENLTYPLTPKEEFMKLDAKTLFFKVAYDHIGFALCLFFPLIVMMIFLSVSHKDFSSGSIRNILMRESFTKYKSKINKIILKISLIVPLFIFLIFIISCVLTRFNFNVDSSVYEIAVYIKWNYDNIFLYLIISYITFFFLCIFYCNIACCFINKNKNMFIVAIASYICWFVVSFLASYLRLIIGLNHIWNRYLNIFDYWNFREYLGECWYGFIVSAMILALVSYLVRVFVLINKEKVIIENEKDII